MAREDDGDSCVGPLAEYARHHIDGHRIEPGERLVEHEDVRTEDQCGGQLDPLLVAEAERLEIVVGPVLQAKAIKPANGRDPRRRAGHAVELAEVRQLVGQSHFRVQPALLGHVPDPASRREVERDAIPSHLARVGAEDAEYDPHRGGLARAVAPDKTEQLAGMDVEREVLHGDGLPVSLRDSTDLEPALGAHVSSGAMVARPRFEGARLFGRRGRTAQEESLSPEAGDPRLAGRGEGEDDLPAKRRWNDPAARPKIERGPQGPHL